MSSTVHLEPAGSISDAADRIVYGAVHLDVIDVERSLAFWRDAVGLRELQSSGDGVSLGAGGRELIVLHPGAQRPVAPGYAGLYHVAIHLPDAVEFARVLARLARLRVPQSPTEHVFSKATYTRDADGIMLELTLETADAYGSIEVTPYDVVIYDAEGNRRQGTEALDVAAALRPLADGDTDLPLAPGSFVGHVHLHVADLAGAYAFYRDVLGFDEHALMRPIGMADLAAGGTFPHRLALNDWHGPTARQPAPGSAGMRFYELAVRGDGALEALVARAAAAGVDTGTDGKGGVTLQDPAGNRIVVRAAAALPSMS